MGEGTISVSGCFWYLPYLLYKKPWVSERELFSRFYILILWGRWNSIRSFRKTVVGLSVGLTSVLGRVSRESLSPQESAVAPALGPRPRRVLKMRTDGKAKACGQLLYWRLTSSWRGWVEEFIYSYMPPVIQVYLNVCMYEFMKCNSRPIKNVSPLGGMKF